MKICLTHLFCWWALCLCAQAGKPVVQIAVTDISCAGRTDGQLELSLFGGTLPVNFQWINLNTSALGVGQFVTNNQPIQLSNLQPGLYRFHFTGNDGADTIIQRLITEPLPLEGKFVLKLAGNGFNLTCADSQDGALLFNTTGGTIPYFYTWSNGDKGYYADSLAAGPVSVSVFDARGCSISADTLLLAPPPILTAVDAVGETCFGQNSGSIDLLSISGGVPPFSVALNDVPAGNQTSWTDLAPGNYFLSVTDAGGCVHQDGVILPTGLDFTLKLPADTTILSGDTLLLNLLINPPADTVFWSPGAHVRMTGPDQALITPPWSATYLVTAVSAEGCVTDNTIRINVDRHRNVYVPNVLAPFAQEAENKAFTVYTGPGVRRVRQLSVYDRFGRLWFENRDFQPNDPVAGWWGNDGRDEAPPGVYVWRMTILYTDGREETQLGDVTLLR